VTRLRDFAINQHKKYSDSQKKKVRGREALLVKKNMVGKERNKPSIKS